jgi:hypothetical protein
MTNLTHKNPACSRVESVTWAFALSAIVLALTILAFMAPSAAFAQTYTYVEAPGYAAAGQPLLFGVAAFKICQIKSFLFAAVYVLAAIALVLFAVRALFTKFEIKQFLPILGAVFVVATADLFIAFVSTDAFYCPSTLSSF